LFRGEDHAPGKVSIQDESIPKSALRVFNSIATREEYRMKKRKNEDDGERIAKRRKGGAEIIAEADRDKRKKVEKKVTLTIQLGESIQHFNRCVNHTVIVIIAGSCLTFIPVELRMIYVRL